MCKGLELEKDQHGWRSGVGVRCGQRGQTEASSHEKDFIMSAYGVGWGGGRLRGC